MHKLIIMQNIETFRFILVDAITRLDIDYCVVLTAFKSCYIENVFCEFEKLKIQVTTCFCRNFPSRKQKLVV